MVGVALMMLGILSFQAGDDSAKPTRLSALLGTLLAVVGGVILGTS